MRSAVSFHLLVINHHGCIEYLTLAILVGGGCVFPIHRILVGRKQVPTRRRDYFPWMLAHPTFSSLEVGTYTELQDLTPLVENLLWS